MPRRIRLNLQMSRFEEVCLPYYGQVESFCRRLLGSHCLAQDAVQETYLRAYHGYASLTQPERARSWLLTIARRYCLDLLGTRGAEALPDNLSYHNDQDLPVLMGQILAGLSERSRSLLILRHCLQLSYQELAEVLEISPPQVGVLLQRARQDALKNAHQKGLPHGL